VNGTTTKKLLDILKLTAISPGRLEEMQNAVKTVWEAKRETIAMLKHDRMLIDADWQLIDDFTVVDDPYRKVVAIQRETSFHT